MSVATSNARRLEISNGFGSNQSFTVQVEIEDGRVKSFALKLGSYTGDVALNPATTHLLAKELDELAYAMDKAVKETKR